jgi:ABC-type thiamine transport system substrate-binding protein
MANRAIKEIEGKFTKEVEIPVTYVTKDDTGKETFETETKTVTVQADTIEGLDAAVDTAL